MLNSIKPGVLCALVALLASVCLASAHEYKTGDLTIGHPWIRATPAGAKTAGGYLKITNHGKQTEKFVGGSATGAQQFEIHEMAMADNLMKMRRLDAPLEIKPGETVELKPGGFHLMLIGLNAPFREGEKIKGTLVFEKAGTVEVEFKVEPMGGKTGHGTPAGHDDAHKGH
jgi:copper(I)-binding protein